MSLLSRERFVSVLAPRRATLLRAEGRTLVPLGAALCDAGWNAAADALQGLVAQAAVRRGELVVVLSSHFAHLRLVPWNDSIGSREELESYARIGFEEVYGPVVAGWALRISPDAAGRARVAVAVEQALLDRLAGLAHEAGLRLASVQPHLMAAYNRLLPRLKGEDFLFAIAEPGRCSVLLARGGQWASVRSSAAGDSEAAIAALLERECELNGVGDPQAGPLPAVYLHAPGRGATAWPTVQGVAPEPLALAAGTDPGPWQEMALAVA